MQRVCASMALICVLTMYAAGCGRDGPLAPWPTFDLGQAVPSPATSNDLSASNDLAAPPDLAPPPLRSWEWVNPGVTGNPLRAVGGTGANDLWLVGEVGTILHWDGQRATVARAAGPNDSFTSVAALAPDDVWIAGQSSSGSILHWDGSSWSSSYAIANQPIHALAVGAQFALATTDVGGAGSIWIYFPGAGWSLQYGAIYGANASILRDITAIGSGAYYSDAIIAVGDKGTIVWQTSGGGFTIGKATAGGADDPFSSYKDYFGVWGAAKDDVWAAFMSGKTIGFTHWDGQAWTVKQTLQLGCTNATGAVLPVDRGKRLVGLDARHILASAGPTFYCPPFAYDGTTWAPLSSTKTQPTEPSFAAAGGRWYAVTKDGQLQVSNNDGSWSPLPQPTRRDVLSAVAVSDDGVWGSSGWQSPTPLRWADGAGWEPHAPSTAKTDNLSVSDLWALAADDVWMAATLNGQGAVLHWDGRSWSPPTVLPGSDRMTSIWASSDEDVWAVGAGNPADGWGFDSAHAFHFDGSSWTDVPLPTHPWGVATPSVFGLRSDAVWISLHIWGTTHRWVWKWDGASFRQVAYWPEDTVESFGRPWATSDDDVWIPSHPVIHWDGAAWNAVASPDDLNITAIHGTRRDDVWAVGRGAFGGAIWHLENNRFVVALDVKPNLYGISGSAHGLPWVVGDNGATLRLVEHAP